MKVTNLFTQADREVFDRIDRDCLAMHVPTPPKTFLRLDVVGPDGEPLERYEDRAHSWVRNAYNVLASCFTTYFKDAVNTNYGEGYLTVTQINGTKTANPRDFLAASRSFLESGVSEQDYSGIVVGTGTTPESFESYSLQTRILHGTTAGKLSFGSVVGTPIPSYDAGTKKWSVSVSRLFNNNSGSNIDVSEVGLHMALTSSVILLACRDLLATPVTVPNAGQLTVTYTIEMTFPA